MEAHARAPEALKDIKPMDKTWNMWKQEFLIFMKVAGYDKKSSEDKAFLLLHTMGKIGLTVLQDMELTEEEKQDFDVLMKNFDDHFNPPKKEAEERYKSRGPVGPHG